MFALVLFPSLPAGAQDDYTFSPPRTEYGHPDLQGYWINRAMTPLQRPEDLGDKRAYTEEEVQALEAERRATEAERVAPIDPNRRPPPAGEAINSGDTDNDFDLELPTEVAVINGEYRTSRIIEPANGRWPTLEGAEDYYKRLESAGWNDTDGPEIRNSYERCLSSLTQIPGLSGHPKWDAIQIIQTGDHVVIQNEWMGVQIVPINGAPDPGRFSRWYGHSTGEWRGDSLQVHTMGFRPEASNQVIRSSEQLEIDLTLALVSENRLLYSYTLTDPGMYSEPVRVETILERMPEGEHFYEGACHEGNYALVGILAGGRRLDVDGEVDVE